ncbi:hypothetical protein VCHC17A1_4028 [Vibrio cholerae HC-17A1]|nr:hypothetical protein VCHC17A1_4028 [Vibrio cholerae HC-17A1]
MLYGDSLKTDANTLPELFCLALATVDRICEICRIQRQINI